MVCVVPLRIIPSDIWTKTFGYKTIARLILSNNGVQERTTKSVDTQRGVTWHPTIK